MFLNNREKPRELLYYEVLSRRADLTRDEQWRMRNLARGFAGEAEYDRLFDAAGHGRLLIYRDLWMKIDKAVLQVDSLIVTDDMLIVNEIKNYSGNYLYRDGRWFQNGRPGGEDPLAQVSRTAGKLVRMAFHLPYRVAVEKKVVFVNPNLDLEVGSDDAAQFAVGRPKLMRYFSDLNQMYAGDAAYENANALRKFFIDDPMPLPVTDVGRLRAGNYCYGCGSYELEYSRYTAICSQCNYEETLERLVVRALIDFTILFPKEKMTKAKMISFTDNQIHEKLLRKALVKYCSKTGSSRSTSYIVKNRDLHQLLKNNGYSSKYEKDIVFKLGENAVGGSF